LLACLPEMLIVHVADEPSGEWLANSIRFSVSAGRESEPGSKLVLARLSELLFVETLRRYIGTLPPDQTGWLGGWVARAIRLSARRSRFCIKSPPTLGRSRFWQNASVLPALGWLCASASSWESPRWPT
jgi:hypothetical protein